MIPVGVLTPHGAAGPEAEWTEMAAGQVEATVARIPAPEGTETDPGAPPSSASALLALATPSALDTAAATLGAVDLLAYASTTTGYALGFDEESALLERLSQRFDLPAVGTTAAAVAALRAFDVNRVALVHPPWFDESFHDLGAGYFRDQGFTVVAAMPVDVPGDPEGIQPDAVTAWVLQHVPDDAEAVFIGGNGFRVAGTVAAMESGLGGLVLESNQVLLWSALARLDSAVRITGHGRLFDAH